MAIRPILLIDGMNIFIRAYIANPAMNMNGEHVGGALGFLNSLASVCKRVNPSKVVVAWEGGGSTRRRDLYAEYKQNSRPVKLNRFYDDDLPDSEENKTWQILLLSKALRQVPIHQIYVPGCEADDVIGCLCQGVYRNEKKVIMTSDHDMYQLLDNMTVVYAPKRKIFITKNDLLKLHHVTVENYALAKAICGDTSDNIIGVKGIGFKTLAKRIPEFKLNKVLEIHDVIAECEKQKGRIKAYDAMIKNKDLITRNLSLVDLRNNAMIGPAHITKIEGTLEVTPLALNKLRFINVLYENSITTYDINSLWQSLRCLMIK